jgi:hypothetical protein
VKECDARLDDHQLLDDRCCRLHETLCREVDAQASADQLAKDLCRQIFEHFRHEEAGYLEEVKRRAPWLADAATVLQGQHRQLRQTLASIVAQLDRPQLTPVERMAVSAEFDNFVVQFQLHEDRENELLQEAFDRDVGNKD